MKLPDFTKYFSSYQKTEDTCQKWLDTKNPRLSWIPIKLLQGANVLANKFFGHGQLEKSRYQANETTHQIEKVSPVAYAIIHTDKEKIVPVIDFLLKQGQAINAPTMNRDIIKTPLTYALEKKDLPLIKFLIDHGALLDEYTLSSLEENFFTNLPIEIASFLQANKIVSPNGETVLMKAVERSDLKEIEKLLQQGASVNAASTSGFTPLLLACRTGKVPVINLLLDNPEIILDKPDHNKQTPFLIACGSINDVDCLKRLQGKNNVNALSLGGDTALSLAAKGGHVDTVKFLLSQPHIDVNKAAGKEKWTPLMFAAYKGKVDIVHELVQSKAKLFIKNKAGKTALHLAQEQLKAGKNTDIYASIIRKLTL